MTTRLAPTRFIPRLPALVETKNKGILRGSALLKAFIKRSRSEEGVEPSKRK